ncbi:MAG TPA: acetate--CoA ligase [Oligoflexia bacterium]|nr:acetate--CoA ligase [Oligoflexia bacterium]HMP27099.1 acetate--CoA ligase [Oligoflexia bacterium]
MFKNNFKNPLNLDPNLAVEFARKYHQSLLDPSAFWLAEARSRLDWISAPEIGSQSNFAAGQISWFADGVLNVCFNVLDRHALMAPEKVAIIWQGNEPEEIRKISYGELLAEVCRMANFLKQAGIKKGDRVTIYLPMIPELVVAMLACARIGAVHSVVFAGFSATALKDRITDCGSRLLITADSFYRGTKEIELKKIVDQALEGDSPIETVLLMKRSGKNVPLNSTRDLLWESERENLSTDCQPQAMSAEDPLFILYTSGSTGKPKGLLHTQAGYLLYAATTFDQIFGVRSDEIHFCAADCGWITGHSYVVYGPLANGVTSLMFESVPNYPDAGRYWQTIEKHRPTTLYTAPTAIRAIAKEGPELPKKYDLSSLRVIGSVGEPINYDAWLWYFKVVGGDKCALVDTWWQTETGGIMISNRWFDQEFVPTYAGPPFWGIEPILLDQANKPFEGGGSEQRLFIKSSWPGQARTIYGDRDRYLKNYLSEASGYYFTGDGAMRDDRGNYRIIGRVDDVLNVAGHRLGSAEIESAIATSGIVAEAAVIGGEDQIKGNKVVAFCVLKDNCSEDAESIKQICSAVREQIGGIAVPAEIYFVPSLPKTRSGKIMRRILRKILAGEVDSLGDISTLADPGAVKDIIDLFVKS